MSLVGAGRPLLEVKGLNVAFETRAGRAHVVRDMSYALAPRETLCVVGESGSGKSVHALAMLGLLPQPPARVLGGQALFEGRDLLAMTEAQLRDVRGREIGVVFQDPMTSLNPVLTIGRQLAEPLVRHGGLSYAKARRRAVDLLRIVGIPDAARRARQFPFQFSGGMRQRAMIAMALSCKPKLLIADEPTTALDVTVQAQILELVRGLRDEFRMAMIWITHDMGVVASLADTVQVVYAGRVMERGPVRQVFARPRNAYTAGLLRSVPTPGVDRSTSLHQIPGQPPRPQDFAPGDPFAPRNPYATERCFRETPPLRVASPDEPDHLVAAWYDLPADAMRRGAR